VKEKVISVTPETVVSQTLDMKRKGYRLVTLTCVELDADTLDILYHFDKDVDLLHLRLSAPNFVGAHSISSVYFAAFHVEN
jgi:ech hydrogenase subunit D